MSADAFRFVFQRPFQWREFIEQAWFVARVSLAPTLLVAIPFTVLVSFTLNILLRELGAADLSGAGAAFGAVTQVGPLVPVLIVVAVGGLGSIWGSFVAATCLGLFDVAGKYFIPELGAFLIYLFMVALLFLRPGGLFGKR